LRLDEKKPIGPQLKKARKIEGFTIRKKHPSPKQFPPITVPDLYVNPK
jgi:hypothetical protein